VLAHRLGDAKVDHLGHWRATLSNVLVQRQQRLSLAKGSRIE
jgi:hypothetical protein